jgi:hypothetical protein
MKYGLKEIGEMMVFSLEVCELLSETGQEQGYTCMYA